VIYTVISNSVAAALTDGSSAREGNCEGREERQSRWVYYIVNLNYYLNKYFKIKTGWSGLTMFQPCG
jgi:hypothetical protein